MTKVCSECFHDEEKHQEEGCSLDSWQLGYTDYKCGCRKFKPYPDYVL